MHVLTGTSYAPKFFCPQTEFLARSDLGLVILEKFGLGTRV